MAVEKLEDGTYVVGSTAFATAEEAFAYDSAQRVASASATSRTTDPLASVAAGRQLGRSARHAPKARLLPYVIALVVASLAAMLYFGPHWTVYRMKAAIEANDATAFSDHVDFPSLKESFKAQLLMKMGQVMKSDGMKDNPFAGLGQMIGMGMINQMVDTLVSPAGVMLMMERGRAGVPKAAAPATATPPKNSPNFAIDYVNYSTVQLQSKDGSPGRFIFRRDGIFSWKLSAIEIPM